MPAKALGVVLVILQMNFCEYLDGFVRRDIQAKDTDRRADLVNLRDDRSVERLDSSIARHSLTSTIPRGRHDSPHHGARSLCARCGFPSTCCYLGTLIGSKGAFAANTRASFWSPLVFCDPVGPHFHPRGLLTRFAMPPSPLMDSCE